MPSDNNNISVRNSLGFTKTALEDTQQPSLQRTNSSPDNQELAEQLGRLQLVTQVRINTSFQV